MFLLRRPSDRRVHAVLDRVRALPFTYPEAGGTRAEPPPGYPLNRFRLRLGTGEQSYRRAVDALCAWEVYRLPWTRLVDSATEPRPGAVVAAVVNHFGFWSINPCRVVYRDEQESGAGRSFAFAIGTLPLHSERGEERFRVRWSRDDDSVWFDLLSFAAADHPLVRVTVPLMRRLQRRFAREAGAAMLRAVDTPPPAP